MRVERYHSGKHLIHFYCAQANLAGAQHRLPALNPPIWQNPVFNPRTTTPYAHANLPPFNTKPETGSIPGNRLLLITLYSTINRYYAIESRFN